MSQLSGEREIEGNSSAQGTGVTTELVMLKEALMCEKAAPEILPFKQELISRISFYLDRTEEEISSLETDGALEVMRSLYQYEESRIKYMLRSYYRVRLMKIEQFVMAILDDDSMLEKLSRHEREFAEGYLMAMGGHMKNTVLNHMPQSFQSLVYQSSASTTKDMVPKPQLDAHVFCQVNEDLGSVDLDNDGETVEFNKGDLFVVRYKPVRHLVDTGKVQLV